MNDFLMKPKVDFAFKEMKFLAWPERSLFYIAKMYTEQIEAGQEYDVLKKCVSISVLDFKLLECEEFYSCFHLREDTRDMLYTDKMEFHIIELPKLPKELKENDNALFLWAKFISSEQKEDFEMLAEKNQYIGSAYERLQNISRDKQKQLEYEAREKAIRDHNQLMKEAREEGWEAGERTGREAGERIGREAGEKIGREKGMVETCRDLGLSQAETVTRVTAKYHIQEEEAEAKVAQYWNE